VLVTLLTAGLCLFLTFENKGRERATPTIQADQSEIALRISSALEEMSHEMASKLPVPEHGAKSGQVRTQVPDKVLHDFMKDTEETLDAGFKDDPTNVDLAIKRVILLHKMGEPMRIPLEELERANSKDAPLLAKALSQVYAAKPNQLSIKSLPPRWKRRSIQLFLQDGIAIRFCETSFGQPAPKSSWNISNSSRKIRAWLFS
jgi:hypothetical protein